MCSAMRVLLLAAIYIVITGVVLCQKEQKRQSNNLTSTTSSNTTNSGGQTSKITTYFVPALGMISAILTLTAAIIGASKCYQRCCTSTGERRMNTNHGYQPLRGAVEGTDAGEASQGSLAKARPKPSAPTNKTEIDPLSQIFSELILNLCEILSKDPALAALGYMKLSLVHLKNKDGAAIIDSKVYESTESVQDFFFSMRDYWNYYDHELLDTVIRATKNKEAIDTLQAFIETKNKNSSKVMPVAEELVVPPKRVPLVADTDRECITQEGYKTIKRTVVASVEVPGQALSLSGSYPGSCILVWHISEEIAASIKRISLLSHHQEELQKCAVIKMWCGHKCLFNVSKKELEPEIHKDILVVTSDDQFKCELKQAGETVVVVDFKADWFSWSKWNQEFVELSKQYTETRFLSVDTEKCKATVTTYKADVVPEMFAFFRGENLYDQLSGADCNQLEAKLKYFLEDSGAFLPEKGYRRRMFSESFM